MKSLIFSLLFLGLSAQAQNSSPTLNNVPLDENTTISIKKGSSEQTSDAKYQIVDGDGDVTGEPDVLVTKARTNWKKACDDWKAEIKEMNKDNQIISLSCNSPTCAKTDATATTCESKGTYKVKTKLN